ncbi:DUF2461 domain-containing protein [Fulvivirga lutimaris]|uniref:DUF2461 domain-containing protein n=1 Tax=Fulvivirga lutimaris TaxID=1819566 RepID=UPI0012BC92FA|nr:DUF2461 domain-containing protein [Fulvivirga lutimaris]MTI41802.1 DUF2461 domain-containing protein [Fulvivirga lutimaris]
MSSIDPFVFKFLNNLRKNNNRDWFGENKDKYVAAHKSVISFADDLLSEMKKHDDIETVSGKKSLFRIYRDVRFSKDKSPYKTHFSGSFKRGTKWLRGGYYFHLEPGNVLIGGGFFSPSKEDLQRIREEIVEDQEPMRQILSDKQFKKHFGQLQGEQLKTAPKGFDKEHPAIDLIRYKQFYFVSHFSDEEANSKGFAQKVSERFALLRPYFNYMSEVLTTDANGLPIV